MCILTILDSEYTHSNYTGRCSLCERRASTDDQAFTILARAVYTQRSLEPTGLDVLLKIWKNNNCFEQNSWKI